MADTPHDPASYNHDNQLKSGPNGQAPRPATEPKGSERSTKTPKTKVDPATGEAHDRAQ